MNNEEKDRIIRLIKSALREKRSKKAITDTFVNAGIINRKGILKAPYKEIYIPVRK
jgi:hypothetical protein